MDFQFDPSGNTDQIQIQSNPVSFKLLHKSNPTTDYWVIHEQVILKNKYLVL